jgi:metacaspase-1
MICGNYTGALSHALIKTMTENPTQSFEQVLINTRAILQGKYSQNPQLCVGEQFDLKQQFQF